LTLYDVLLWVWTLLAPWLSTPIIGQGSVLAIVGSVLAYLVGYYLQKRRVSAEEAIKAYFAMLDNVHEYSMKYYYPMATAAGGLSYWLKEACSKPTEANDRRAFYYYAKFNALAGKMTLEHMTYLLTNYEAESAAQALQNKIQAFAGLDSIELSLLGKLIGADDRYVDISAQIDRGFSITAIFRKFQEWLNVRRASKESKSKITEIANFSEAYANMITYELNMMMSKAWYRRKPQSPSADNMTAIRSAEPYYMRGLVAKKLMTTKQKLGSLKSRKQQSREG
jgi:hypothetical protein